MMNIRQRSVNVNRRVLLEKLHENLAIHRVEYKEALSEYHARLEADLKLALKKVRNIDPEHVESLKSFRFSVPFPQNHEQDYLDVIEMLELSVDENINLDAESFKAYIKNEWAWQSTFVAAKMAYATVGSSLTV